MTYYLDLNQQSLLNDQLDDIPRQALPISDEEAKKLLEGLKAGGILYLKDDVVKVTPPCPSQAHEWDGSGWIILTEKQTSLLESQRQQVRDAINALRDRKINGGVYVPAIDKWIDTDATAERNILSVKATFDLFGDQEIPWTFADNSVAMINKEKLLVIWQVLMEAKTGNHANALKHKAMVEQVENPLEYDYSSGWTQTYDEFAGVANG
ncbi:putative tail fiber assembly protein [Actinobacillus minor NM305]|uniref:Putative tail fiber assembly protein n=1 Tax=Actinobacillus minor NM305 TaxID=637911 RepID=C5S4L1_9PAST|nr:DUF4376 domain-containing protein [Actinobacillus minor]EER46155.1 putative tail fiber assembly protein [Actinobacillus minor NM305]